MDRLDHLLQAEAMGITAADIDAYNRDRTGHLRAQAVQFATSNPQYAVAFAAA